MDVLRVNALGERGRGRLRARHVDRRREHPVHHAEIGLARRDAEWRAPIGVELVLQTGVERMQFGDVQRPFGESAAHIAHGRHRIGGCALARS
jgi:hypothetical protein